MRSRAIIAGILSFSLLFTLVVVLLNTLHRGSSGLGQWLAYSLIWVAPGYISSHFSGSRFLLHGAVTGLVIGTATAVGILVGFEAGGNVPVSAPEVFLGILVVATCLSTLGAVIGHMHQLHTRS